MTDNIRNEYRVFIVDDHPLVREGLTIRINREKDLTVCGDAENVSTALKSIADSKPDIVIADLTLKDESGLRLIENLLLENKELLILVLSMHDESIYAEKCLKAGARGYIMKEESPERVLSAIRSVLKGELYVGNELKEKLLNKFFKGNPDEVKSPVQILSNREFEVYQLVGKAFTAKEISGQLNIGAKTVENHIKSIKKKLHLKRSREIIIHAAKYLQ